jgi:hypothetical protein
MSNGTELPLVGMKLPLDGIRMDIGWKSNESRTDIDCDVSRTLTTPASDVTFGDVAVGDYGDAVT